MRLSYTKFASFEKPATSKQFLERESRSHLLSVSGELYYINKNKNESAYLVAFDIYSVILETKE